MDALEEILVPWGIWMAWRKCWCSRGFGGPGRKSWWPRGHDTLEEIREGLGALKEMLVLWKKCWCLGGIGCSVGLDVLLPCWAGVRPPKQIQNHLILNKSLVSSQCCWMLCVSDPDFLKFRIRSTFT